MHIDATTPATAVFRYILEEYGPTRDDRAAASRLRREWDGFLREFRRRLPRPGPLTLHTILRQMHRQRELATASPLVNIEPDRRELLALIDDLCVRYTAQALVTDELDLAPLTDDTPLGPQALAALLDPDTAKLIAVSPDRLVSLTRELNSFKATDNLEPFFKQVNYILGCVDINRVWKPKVYARESAAAAARPLTVASLAKATETLEAYKMLRRRAMVLHAINRVFATTVDYIDELLGIKPA